MIASTNPQLGKKNTAILQRQVESLEILAGRIGISRHALETRTINDSCWQIEQTIEQTRQVVDAFGSFAGFSFDFMRNELEQMKARDFWEDLASLEQTTHLFAVHYIAREAQHLPIDWSFLLNFAKEYRLPEPAKDYKNLKRFLQSIPSAYIFNHEFNAFIEWNKDDSLPCIFYDTLLINSLSEVPSLISLYAKINESNSTKKTNKEIGLEELVEQGNLLIDKLLGRKLLVRNEKLVEETPKDYLGRVGMNAAASLFVTSHEIGHLLLGHIEKDPNPNLEYEADAFATLIVGMSRWINKEFAIASVFALIDIIEADNPQSAFHPNSLKRFGNVIAQTNEMKAEIDWGYVGNLLKSVLDKSAVSRVGRRVFEDISELRTNCQGEK